MSYKYVIVFNGPPTCGKDLCAEYFASSSSDCFHKEFKKPLFDIAKAIAQISDGDWDYLYHRDRKELPTDKLFGYSPREWMIKTSEEVIKPVFGKSYFGDVLAKSLEVGYNYISDGGFIQELLPVIEMAEHVLVIRLYRDGCNFDNDSRDYLPDVIEGATVVDVYNNGSIKELFDKISLIE